MLMPNATDMLAGRDVRLGRPEDMEEHARSEARELHPVGMVRRLARATGRLMSLFL